jgi:uncharacterized membrane protein YdbT with pleckstrin-like domain
VVQVVIDWLTANGGLPVTTRAVMAGGSRPCPCLRNEAAAVLLLAVTEAAMTEAATEAATEAVTEAAAMATPPGIARAALAAGLRITHLPATVVVGAVAVGTAVAAGDQDRPL